MAAFPRFANSTRLRLAGVGLAGLGLVLAGCASDPETTTTQETPSPATPAPEIGTSPAAVITQAGQKTIETGSARFTATGTTKGVNNNTGKTEQATKYSMEGSYDFENHAIEAKMNGAIFGEQGDVEIISVDGLAYMKMPSLGSDKWLKTPLPPSSGGSFSDPTKTFDELRQLANLREVGPDTVDGVQATKYSGTTKDIKEALASAGVPVSEGDAGKITGKSKTSVWIDDDGHIIKLTNETKAEAAGVEVESSTSVSFYDLGSDVDIQAPPADQVSDLSDLSGIPSQ